MPFEPRISPEHIPPDCPTRPPNSYTPTSELQALPTIRSCSRNGDVYCSICYAPAILEAHAWWCSRDPAHSRATGP